MFNGYKVQLSSAERKHYWHLNESNLGNKIGNVTNKLHHKNKTWKFFPDKK